MNPDDPNILLVELVVKQLGELCNELVFVGGCATGLLVTDPARPPVRATKDVDLIAEVVSKPNYYVLHDKLKEKGFIEDKDVMCRWRLNDLKIDVMPTNEDILGYTNRWHALAIQEATSYKLPSGYDIRLIIAPIFIATKLEAFYYRGNNDYGASHDMEDIITVIDGRPELIAEITSGNPGIRNYLREEFEDLLGEKQFTDTLSWHLAGDTNNQARLPEILSRLRMIAGI